VSSIKFHDNPSSGGRVGACGQTDGWWDNTQTWRS